MIYIHTHNLYTYIYTLHIHTYICVYTLKCLYNNFSFFFLIENFIPLVPLLERLSSQNWITASLEEKASNTQCINAFKGQMHSSISIQIYMLAYFHHCIYHILLKSSVMGLSSSLDYKHFKGKDHVIHWHSWSLVPCLLKTEGRCKLLT